MIKITLPAMGHEANVEKYVLSKKNDEIGIVTSIDTEAVFEQPAFSELLEMTARGIIEEDADINILCGGEETTLEGLISHIEGKPNLKHCYFTKPVRFKTVYDCIKDIDINIFDYTPDYIETVPGELQRDVYQKAVRLYSGFPNTWTLNEILLELGGIPDRRPSGWSVEFIQVQAEINEFVGRAASIYVSYVRSISNTQISSDWQLLNPGVYFLKPTAFPSYAWGVPVYGENKVTWKAGKNQLYKDVDVSNTYSLNEILLAIFNCSGKTIVSNFFNINPDMTEPNNSAYQYAVNFCHEIRIVQSFDIIRESALRDSFEASGSIEALKLIKDINNLFG